MPNNSAARFVAVYSSLVTAASLTRLRCRLQQLINRLTRSLIRDCEHEARENLASPSMSRSPVPGQRNPIIDKRESSKKTSIPGLPRANAGLCTGSRLLYLSDLNPALHFYGFESTVLYYTAPGQLYIQDHSIANIHRCSCIRISPRYPRHWAGWLPAAPAMLL